MHTPSRTSVAFCLIFLLLTIALHFSVLGVIMDMIVIISIQIRIRIKNQMCANSQPRHRLILKFIQISLCEQDQAHGQGQGQLISPALPLNDCHDQMHAQHNIVPKTLNPLAHSWSAATLISMASFMGAMRPARVRSSSRFRATSPW